MREAPEGEARANWLPAPAAPIYLLMRLYLPSMEALNGAYEIPGIRRLRYRRTSWELSRELPTSPALPPTPTPSADHNLRREAPQIMARLNDSVAKTARRFADPADRISPILFGSAIAGQKRHENSESHSE